MALSLRGLMVALVLILPLSAYGRWLDTQTGRWIEKDPLGTMNAKVDTSEHPLDGYVRGMSLYEYVRTRPTVAVDPDGLELRFGTNDDEKFFQVLANALCPEGKFKIKDPPGPNNRRLASKDDSEFCNDYQKGRGWSCSSNTITVKRDADTSSRPITCGCLCDAINSKKIITLYHKTPMPGQSHDPGGMTDAVNWDKVYVGTGRSTGYAGRYANPADKPSTMSPGRVLADQAIILAHELCGHALPQMPHPPVGDPTRYTDQDPVIKLENEIRLELGPRYGHRN